MQLYVSLAIIAGLLSPQVSGSQTPRQHVLHLLAANLTATGKWSSPIVIYAINDHARLYKERTVIPGGPSYNNGNRGIYSIHEAGPYIIINAPHDLPSRTTFLSTRTPFTVTSYSFGSSALGLSETSHWISRSSAGQYCDSWPFITIPPQIDGAGNVVSFGASALTSTCIDPNNHITTSQNSWGLFQELEWDGQSGGPSIPETILAKIHHNKVVPVAAGSPEIVLCDLPDSLIDITRTDRVVIKAANRRYVILSPLEQSTDGILYVRDSPSARWSTLHIPGDSSEVRLLGNWLVVEVRAKRIAETFNDQFVAPEGGGFTDREISSEYEHERSAHTVFKGKIVLRNLASGAEVSIPTNDEDSEVIGILDESSALVRIKDSLYLADIGAAGLGKYTLLVRAPEITQVHWAFYTTS